MGIQWEDTPGRGISKCRSWRCLACPLGEQNQGPGRVGGGEVREAPAGVSTGAP